MLQDPTLKVEQWTIMDAKNDAKVTHLVLSADPSVVESIEKVNCKPQLGLSRRQIKILSKAKKHAMTVKRGLPSEQPLGDADS